MFKYLNQKQRVLKERTDSVKRFILIKIGQFRYRLYNSKLKKTQALEKIRYMCGLKRL